MAENSKSDIIDIRATLNMYLSRWYLFVIAVVACLALAFAFLKIRKPVYGVRANVLIQVDNMNPLSAMGAVGDLLGSKGRVDDELYVISSHSLYRDVIKDLGINQLHYVKQGFLKSPLTYPDAPLTVITDPMLPDTLTEAIKFTVKVDKQGLADIKVKVKRSVIAEEENQKLPATIHTIYGDYTIAKTEYFTPGEDIKDRIIFMGYHAAAEDLSEEIHTEIASKKSNAIELAINTQSADYGKAVLDKIIEEYNKRGIREKNIQGEKTSQFISDRLVILSEGLTEAEMAIQDYKEKNQLTDFKADAEYQFTKKGTLEGELLSAETNSEIIKMIHDFLDDPANAYSLVPAALDNKGLQEAIEAYNKVVLQRMELLNTARPNNKALQMLNEQIDAMRANIISSVDKSYESALIAVKDLRREKAEADARLGSIPRQERDFINLKRQQQVKQELYTFLLQRNEETAMLMANAVPKGIIVDEAYTLNKPVGLSNMMVMLIALILGIALAPAYLYVKKLLRSKFESREEAERVLDAPVLGEISTTRATGKLVVKPRSTSSVTELFRLMRTNLLFMLNDRNDKVVLMTSTRSGEGKTFISINLAASIALMEKKRVLLIGMDIRKPEIANYMNIAPSPGLTQYLAGSETSIDSIIRKDVGVENLDMIVAGPIPPNPSELLASERVDELVKALRERYDYIIIDSAPVGMVSDTFVLDRVADATVYVTRVNHSTFTDLRFINDIYEHRRLKKLSVVINGTNARKGYGYGYQDKDE